MEGRQSWSVAMASKYDWSVIQLDYDSGMSQRKLMEKYGMSINTLYKASKRDDLKCRSRSDAAKLSNALNPRKHTNEFKEKQSKRIIARYEDGWMPKAGRCDKYKYQSNIAGEVSLDGTWELEVAKWLDKQGYNWRRNTKRFPYTNLKGQISHYTPDFWVEEFDGYLEVKGYETPLDHCKWSQFKESLTVWKKSDIKLLKQVNNFTESGPDGKAARC